ncbi:hypothetical protein EJ05DRAFT_27928 [Pseudovirgaria hyperparasitica]|uniref:Uncharacterized protein n=1 Tax=Pseudovirgaria hyperparasitica TaxID=470096 RepID=A0A6A6WLT8_9PEZI|nr:uncharacterized protein EJ05DRAFT_27928 [Pseudovirgaria hyperparasitica]KAF2763161.1 hypothetical protein EJ05DRAFT_27928 [Pseudovirgaria hyperparasitica]
MEIACQSEVVEAVYVPSPELVRKNGDGLVFDGLYVEGRWRWIEIGIRFACYLQHSHIKPAKEEYSIHTYTPSPKPTCQSTQYIPTYPNPPTHPKTRYHHHPSIPIHPEHTPSSTPPSPSTPQPQPPQSHAHQAPLATAPPQRAFPTPPKQPMSTPRNASCVASTGPVRTCTWRYMMCCN